VTTDVNAAQFEAWNGESGQRWVARADQRDRVLAPVAEALLTAASPTRGAHVLDIGSGCGATTLMASTDVGNPGSVTGVDLSRPMLDVAQERARAIGAGNATFTQADAQIHAFELGSVDLIISRFGTMFFSDPEAAFINIGKALHPGGRLVLATWQSLADNEWLTLPGEALLRHTDMRPTSAEPLGMFSQSDPDLVTATLEAAGFIDIVMDATEVMFTLGRDVDEAVEYLADTGPGRMLLETIRDGPGRIAALAEVRHALADHCDRSGVRLGGGIWLIEATWSDRCGDAH